MPAAFPGDYVKHDDAYAAMCIIEEMCDPVGSLPDAPRPWADYRDQTGIAEIRDYLLSYLAPEANAAWEKAYARYESGGPQAVDPGSFDYDFIPSWLRVAVKWDEPTPRVLGKGGKS